MILVKRFFDAKLAQVSYLIGDSAARHAVVIDANRDVEQYIRAAAEEGVAITHVTETHIHADFVSGSRELAARTGAKLLLSGEGGPDWQYAFANEADANLLEDGDRFDVGSVRVDALHTPGHTPEHLTFLITDTSVLDEPLAAVTGDFLFVGDVGRPDLLERAANVAGTMEPSARALFASLKRLEALPDHLQIWPGHGAGSACGKGLGSLPQTTLGYERRTNWALAPMSEREFVARVLTGQPDPPAYFAEMKRINKEGPTMLGSAPRPERLTLERVESLVASGKLVIDTRPAAEFAAVHIPGTINIPLNRAFTTWAGWFVPYDADYHLIVDDRCSTCQEDALRDLQLIGLDRVRGYAAADVVTAWQARGHATARVGQIDADGVARRLAAGSALVIDVRSTAEWQAGHIPGARHIPLGELTRKASTLPRERPIVVHCQGGARSAIAASLLQAEGVPDVLNLAGGFNEWRAAGLPVEDRPAVPAATR
jgi:hydroxyacylglutathione hydrolase